MEKVLIIEDDELIAELERDYLEAGGFQVEIALDGTTGLQKAQTEEYGTVVLDVMLPGKSGFEICRELRRDQDLPIIMVTARKEDVDKIRGLGLGADDYMVKPFSPAELVARVRSHIMIHRRLLERNEGRRPAQLLMGDLKILPEERRVFLAEEEIVLANKEFELLLFMAQNPNIAFSKETLFNRIWGMDSAGATDTVTVHINRLRQKLERNPSCSRMIETVWGVGYRFKINDIQ